MKVKDVYKVLNKHSVRAKVEELSDDNKVLDEQIERLKNSCTIIGVIKDSKSKNEEDPEVAVIYGIAYGGPNGDQRWLDTILVSKYAVKQDIETVVYALWEEKLNAKFNPS